MKDDEKPTISLHESQWKREGKPDPVLGENGFIFIAVLLFAVPFVYGLAHLMGFLMAQFGFWGGIAAFAVLSPIVMLFCNYEAPILVLFVAELLLGKQPPR